MKLLSAALKKCPLFKNIPETEYEDVIHCLQASVRTYPKDAPIFTAGDTPSCIGVVLSGNLAIVQVDYWGSRNILSVIDSGDLFGEAFACAEVPALPVSVTARTDCQVLLIPHEKLLSSSSSACSFHTRLIQNLIRVLAQKNIGLTQKIRHISKKSTRQKIMSYLSSCAIAAGSNTFTIPLNRQEMADYLSVERSALSSVLSSMQKEALIQFHKNQFQIQNPHALYREDS